MADLHEKNKDELLELAKEREIEGRSSMSKDELVEALEANEVGSDDEQEQSELEQRYSELPDDAPEVPGVTGLRGGTDQSHIEPPLTGPPLRRDQPGMYGNAVNPERPEGVGLPANLSTSRTSEKLEAAKESKEQQREQLESEED